MQRIVASGFKRAYSSSARSAAAAESAQALSLSFCTPHQAIIKKKTVSSVTIPGSSGEYGVTFGHSALISQMQPGVVTVTHLNVRNMILSFIFNTSM